MDDFSSLFKQQPPAAPKPFEPEGRGFDDIAGTRDAIFNNVLKAVQERPPVQNDRYTLRIANAAWENQNPYTLAQQKEAIMARKSLGRKLKGEWELVDNTTGDVVDRRKTTLAQVPYQTDRATFISNGREYSLANQFRLQSGIYARRKADGELESHVNLLPGTGRSFRVRMNPTSGKFFADVGQAAVPLYPILRATGVSDDVLEKRWGKDVLDANRTSGEKDHVDVTKAYERLVGGSDPKEKHAEALKEYITKMRVNPDVARSSIGKYMDTPEDAEFAMSPEVLAATAQKLIAINKGEDEPDDRDSLANQTLMGPEDLFAERLTKDSGNLMRKILWRSTYNGKLSSVPVGAFTPQMENVLMSSGLGSPLEEINPMEALDHQLRVSRMGTGGIPCATPEVEVYTREGWLSWPEVTGATELAICVEGQLDFSPPIKLHKNWYDGLVYAADTRDVGYRVTPNHRMYCAPAKTRGWGAYRFETADRCHGKKRKHLVAVSAYSGGDAPPVFEIEPGREVPMELWAEFLGYYLADGSVTYRPGTVDRNAEYRVTLSKLDSDPIYKRYVEIFCLLGYRPTARYKDIKVNSKALAAYLRQFGTAAHKYVPDYIRKAGPDIRDVFLRALLAGDSSLPYPGAILYASASKRLRDDVEWLVISLGKSGKVREADGQHQLYITDKTEAGVGGQARNRPAQYWTERYSGYVYCATVPGGMLYMRRNGKALWTGNSTDAIPNEARGVQPTYLGFVDPFRTTECYTDDTEFLGEKKWIKWAELRKDTKLATWENDQIIYECPQDFVQYSIGGLIYKYQDETINFAVTPRHRMWVSRNEEDPCHIDMIDDVYKMPMWVQLATGKKHQLKPDGFTLEKHEGFVICVTMRTGLLIVRRGNTAGFVCGNSEKIGVDGRLAVGLRKGNDGQIYRQMVNQAGEKEWVSARQAAGSAVAFPGELESGNPMVRAMVKGQMVEVPREEVQYGLAVPDDMDDLGVNLIPFANNTQGNRLVMAGKMMLQSMSLQNREAPLVMNRVTGTDESYEGRVGAKMGALRTKTGGTVVAVSPQGATIQADDGTKEEIEFHDNFPLNRKSYYYNKPLVELGQRVEPGQLVAGSNYTDDKGNLALGTHLRVGYMPYKGLAHEDAYVMSESAAKKMTHEAMYTSDFEKEEGVETGREKFLANFPGNYSKEQLGNLDKHGVIQPGSVVRKGDPLVLAVGQPKTTGEGQRELHRNAGLLDKSVTWEHDYEGTVTDAYTGDDGGVRVAVKAAVPLQRGDKISGLFGDKGVVTKIVPDHLMPADASGKALDLIQNPLTVPTRKNPAQFYASLLSKVAQKTGQPYMIDKFSGKDMAEFVREELRKAGMDEEGAEELFDPDTGRSLKKVMTGAKYTMKLHHTAESKSGARDFGGYDAAGTPQRGGEEGAKSMSGLGLNALLSHNAFANIQDMKEHKATRNDEFWRAFQLGQTPPMPEVPLVYRKVMAHLQGAGVNLKRKGDYTHLTAMTDKDVERLTEDRVITKPETLDDKRLQPIPGGLFDRSLVGGVGGERWARIDLPEPMPSPVMENAIKSVLGLSGKEFDALVSGERQIDGKSGGEAMQAALARINLDDSIEATKNVIREGSKTARDKAVKKLRVLQTAKDQGIHPKDWMINKVPVLPPVFRPISKMSSGTSIVSDPNYLYQDLLYNNDALRDARKALGQEGSTEERLNAYKALRAVTGLGDPIHPKLQEKNVAGLLKHVFGKGSPKFGMYQRKVVGMNVDMSGRAVIGVDPDLDMDEVGVPETQAWKMYRPFVVRQMVKKGMPATRALKLIEDKAPEAKDALLKEMENRPILTTRAPALHRYNIMAARPRLVSGKALIMPPLILSGFTADIDGDAMSMHVPVSDDAVKEAYEKLLPSKHLKNASEFKVHYLPTQEYQLGLYQATQKANKGGKTHHFRSFEEMKKAYRRGEIGLTDNVVLPDEEK